MCIKWALTLTYIRSCVESFIADDQFITRDITEVEYKNILLEYHTIDRSYTYMIEFFEK